MLRRMTSTGTVFGWLVMTVGTMAAFWSYEATPGEKAHVAASAPATSSVILTPGRKSLLVFIHPKCACTKATLSELRTIWNGLTPEITPACTFILRQPAQTGNAWRETDIERACREFIGTQIIDDYAGAEAQRFGVTTSGTCLLYDQEGQLLFAGGITASRGHIGPAASQEVLREQLASSSGAPIVGNAQTHSDDDRCPVFGCPLFSPDDKGIAK